MNIIISLFTEYLKPILIGLASLLGLFLVSKASELESENQELTDSLEDENKKVEVQNEVIKAVKNIAPTDIDGITDLMRENKL